uniref:Uncharacterized protein n=1 Tax=Octopus bimaculoides TaxID=37653 RepID=A0A0L8G5A5_OCTBM
MVLNFTQISVIHIKILLHIDDIFDIERLWPVRVENRIYLGAYGVVQFWI